jgi:hypothetical protein
VQLRSCIDSPEQLPSHLARLQYHEQLQHTAGPQDNQKASQWAGEHGRVASDCGPRLPIAVSAHLALEAATAVDCTTGAALPDAPPHTMAGRAHCLTAPALDRQSNAHGIHGSEDRLRICHYSL